jgi:uroporphyrinogen III methyltransferase/synthase
VSISPVTTAAAREAGLPVHAEAAEYTWPGLFQAILEAEQAEDIPG